MPARLITMQSHSEMNDEILRELLDHRRGKGLIDQERYENAISRISKDHDGLVVAKAFLKFCLK